MCFLTFVFHFYSIKSKWKKYMKLKERSRFGIEEVRPLDPIDRCWYWLKTGYKFLSRKYKRKMERLFTENTLSHFILMALLGWIVGSLVSIIHFYSSMARGNSDVFYGLVVKMPILVLITMTLSFTKKGRCILLLIPTHLFSGQGQVYVEGMLVVSLTTGPVMNLKHNLNIIQESSACQQQGVAEAAAEIADILFGPFTSFKQAALEIVNGIKTMVNKLQLVLASFKRTAMLVADAVQDATRWINSKINGCKNTVGTTYQHCMNAFTWMYDECKVSVPSVFVKMCAVTEFASNLCKSVKPGEYLCDLVYFNVDPLITTVSQRISRLLDRAYTLMYFSVNIHHEFHVDSNSKSIMSEIKTRVEESLPSVTLLGFFLGVVEVGLFLFHFYFLLIVWRYRSMYFRRDEFDNYFITQRLKDIDHLETLHGRESIFPLRRSERRKLIYVCSPSLVKSEWRGFSFPILNTIKVVIYLGIVGLDYLLYMVVDQCRIFMLAVMQTFGSRTEISIEGSGFLAELSRRVVRALNFMDYNFYQAHFMPCVPNPRPPNNWTTFYICFWIVVLVFSWTFKPFVLRIRHKIMDWYHPDVADRRARWLYNHILFRRVSFLKLIGIKLRGKYGGDSSKMMFSIPDFLRAKYPCVTYIIGKGLIGSYCRVCHHVVPPLYSCPTQDCNGIYCDECYVNIRGVCAICREAMMIDDFKERRFEEVLPDQGEIDDIKEEVAGYFEILEESDLDYGYQSILAWEPTEQEENLQTTQYNFENDNDSDVPTKSRFSYGKL